MSTTFLWTEQYGAAASRLREALGAFGFGAALALLIVGVAGLFGMQASFGDAVAHTLGAL
jgi:hypothetical protein